MQFSYNSQCLLVACENGNLMGFSVDLSTSNRKCLLLFSIKTDQPKIVSLSHDYKEKYIFTSFSDSSIGIYENLSNFKKAPYFIDKIKFHNPVNKILNTFQKDNLIIGCKNTCVAFCNPQNLKSKFILHVENTELNGFLYDNKKQILWTFGNDKTLRAWEVSPVLFGKEGSRRIITEWNKDKIFDALDLKTITHYVKESIKGGVDKLLKKDFSSSEEDQLTGSEDEKEEEIKERKEVVPRERSFKEDFKNIIPSFKNEPGKVEENQQVYDSEDEDSAAKKYGLVRNTNIENLAVSNSENDSENEERKVVRKVKKVVKDEEKGSSMNKQKVEDKVESETESDDDLTGWF